MRQNIKQLVSKEYLENEYINKKQEWSSIAKNLGCSIAAIKYYSQKFGIKSRNAPCIKNAKYFDTWSSNMAWILGFTMADGCIHVQKTKKQNVVYNYKRLEYNISTNDEYLLEFIRDEISPQQKIYHRTSYKNNCKSLLSHLVITSDEICNKLEKFNIFPNKTGNEEIPIIPDEYFGDWLRGYFDGDGHISVTPRKGNNNYHYRLDIGSQSEKIIYQLIDKTGLGNIYKGNNAFYKWYIGSRYDILRIYNLMYKDENDFCLKRKKDVFEQIVLIQNDGRRKNEYKRKNRQYPQ